MVSTVVPYGNAIIELGAALSQDAPLFRADPTFPSLTLILE
jgi:hypothetical protein